MGVFSRVIDWFWQRSAERALRASDGVPSPRVLELGARAALAAEAATRTLRPAEPFTRPGNEALACELYREAIHWALLAHDTRSDSSTPPDVASAATVDDLRSLLERVDGDLLRRAAGGDPELAELRPRLAEASYVEFAELAPGEQKKLAQRLESFCRNLLEPLSGVRTRLERVWVRRVVHVLVLAGVILGGLYTLDALLARTTDLARSAAWKTSSIHPHGGCKSPQQHCAGGENYFFHTAQETDPWIVFDLGKQQRVSGVEIENRVDCCFERAKLLVVDVSSDRKKWKVVARSKDDFNTFRRRFTAVKARYVRIHVPHPESILHLSAVRIFR